jgi:hypothetical protein
MRRPRSELLRGIALLSAFLVLVVLNGLLLPASYTQAGYTVIDVRGAEPNPIALEGTSVSPRTTILAMEDHEGHSGYITSFVVVPETPSQYSGMTIEKGIAQDISSTLSLQFRFTQA